MLLKIRQSNAACLKNSVNILVALTCRSLPVTLCGTKISFQKFCMVTTLHLCMGLFEMIVGGFNNLSYTIRLRFLVISFCGVTSRIRFMFLLFPQVSRN